jgi:hypothetical protein
VFVDAFYSWKPCLSSTIANVLLGTKRVNAQDTPSEPTPDLQLKIAHLLLIDAVG